MPEDVCKHLLAMDYDATVAVSVVRDRWSIL
jgi:hypothetical protein